MSYTRETLLAPKLTALTQNPELARAISQPAGNPSSSSVYPAVRLQRWHLGVRDLASKRLHVFDPQAVPKELKGLTGDRTTEGQHFRVAGLNLLTAIIIYWNTRQLGIVVAQRQKAGLDCSPNLLAHISLLGWAHILLTGEYRWRYSRT